MADNHPASQTYLNALEMRLLERIEKTETTLLKEFRKWAVPIAAKQRIFESTFTGVNERLDMIEDRLRELEER